MMDYIFVENFEPLKDNIFDETCKMIYMKKNIRNYFVHIVCCEFSDEEALKQNWMELVNNVSEFIQKGLREMIEIYNVYIVFFQTNIEDASLVYEIEQNKYSSRKIVISHRFPEDKEKLVKIVNSKLFDLKIEKDDKEQFCFQDKILQNNNEDEIEKYIEKHAWEIMNEKN